MDTGIERRFNPDQPRDSDGQWTDGLAARISLGARERLVSSKRFRPGRGSYRSGEDYQAAGAVVEGPRGREVRLGVVATVDDQADQWDANPDRDDTTSLNRRSLRRLRNDLAGAASKAQSAGEDDEDAVAAGQAGEIQWSVFLEDDGSYSTSVSVGDGDALTLDAKQLARFLTWLDDLDGQLETARARTLPRTPSRAPNPAVSRPISRGEPAVQLYDRTYPLDDIQIQRSGDGRTVEAYAAMFEAPYEVRDEHGHYMEAIDRAAFNRTLNGGAGRNAMCLYNHGRNLEGKPDSLASIPLGSPLEIRPDGRGLLTVTRYNKGPYTDQVLESIRNGDIKAQSFRGRIVRSSPNGRVPRSRYGTPLPTVTRHELGLTDYGPTPIPVNLDAEIVAVRSVRDLITELQELDADEREELLRSLNLDESTHDGDPDNEDEDDDPDEDVDEPATPDGSGPGAEDPPAERSTAHSGRLEIVRARLRMEWTRRGVRRGEAA